MLLHVKRLRPPYGKDPGRSARFLLPGPLQCGPMHVVKDRL